MKNLFNIPILLLFSGVTSCFIFILLISSLFVNCQIQGTSAKENSYYKCTDFKISNDMRCIEGGSFIRGSNKESIDETSYTKIRDEYPEEEVTVTTFFMDTYEVTYSEYQECVKAKACTPAHPNYKGFSRPKQPMLGVNWYQARDYCSWRKKRLPTEAEWEKAARGAKGDMYPWGNEKPNCKKAVIKENGKEGCYTGTTFDVGSRPAYKYGLYDMAGNSWEWVNDWYSKNYNECGKDCKGTDPKGPCSGNDNCPGHKLRVVRGGSWWWDGIFTRGSNRRSHFPNNKPYHHLGFRCAKSADKD